MSSISEWGFQGGFPLWAFSRRHLGFPTFVWMWLSSGSDTNCVVFVSPKFYFWSTLVTVCGNRRNILNSSCEDSREGNCREVPQGGGTSHVWSVRKITSHLKRLRAVLDPFLNVERSPPNSLTALHIDLGNKGNLTGRSSSPVGLVSISLTISDDHETNVSFTWCSGVHLLGQMTDLIQTCCVIVGLLAYWSLTCINLLNFITQFWKLALYGPFPRHGSMIEVSQFLKFYIVCVCVCVVDECACFHMCACV